jgi:hypothetical protein
MQGNQTWGLQAYNLHPWGHFDFRRRDPGQSRPRLHHHGEAHRPHPACGWRRRHAAPAEGWKEKGGEDQVLQSATPSTPTLRQPRRPPRRRRRHRSTPGRCMVGTRRSGHGGTRSAHLGGGSSAPRPRRRRGPTAAPAVAVVPGTSSPEQREAQHRSPSSTFPAPRPLRHRVASRRRHHTDCRAGVRVLCFWNLQSRR